MQNIKQQILDELIEHLSNLQGGGLKSLLDESKKPELPEAGELPEDPSSHDGSDPLKPKGLKVESVEVTGKPGFDQKADSAMKEISGEDKDPSSETDMSDEELKELLSKLI